MNWQEIISTVLITVITGAVTAVSSFLIAFIKRKINDLREKSEDERTKKLLGLAEDVISTTVDAAQQTIVDSLKKQNNFTQEAAQEVFENVKDKILNTLTEETKKAIEEVSNMDIADYISDKIEAQIAKNKK